MASSDARPIPIKNTAYRVTFPIWDADGDLVTGATGLDSEVSTDGGTFTDCTNEATEIATSSGMYFLDLTSGEMNADTVAIIVKTTSAGAKTTPIILYPNETGDIDVDVTAWLGSAAATPTVAGVPEVDITHIAGSAVSTTTAQLGVNVVQISTDATAADNAELFFDGTGYAGGTTKLQVDAVAISGDTTAADNLEAEYDGTGYKDYIRRNTAQAGTASTIQLDASAANNDDLYNGLVVAILSGTGAGQARLITDYVGSTTTASVAPDWDTNPASGSVFVLLPWARVDLALWLGVAPNALTSGRVDATVGAMQSNVVTAASIATDAIDADALADGAITAATFAAGAIDATAIAADAIGSSELATSAVNEIRDSILSDSTSFQGARIDATISSRATPAQVNTEVLDVLTVDTFAEPSAVVAGTATLKDMLNWLKALARNRVTMTATTQTLRNDANSADVATSTQSDDGTTYVRGEWS